MTQWETCEIKMVDLEHYESKSGGLLKKRTTDVWVWQWVAKKTDSSGSQMIYESPRCLHRHIMDVSVVDDPVEDQDEENLESEYQKMIASLSQEGWEPAATDKHGRITLMKRKIAGPDSRTDLDAANLLQQLANLRDAGILTEQEFQLKKNEILRRM